MGSMDRIDQAFKAVKRANFVPHEVKKAADIDMPLPIGFGQTNSQPTTVRMMLRWLDPKPGDKVLDVGSGSGWTTTLLAYLVGSKGKVYAVERIPQLLEFGKENCQRAGVKNVEFFKAGKEYGLPDKAPFDRILVSASAQELPAGLPSQLKVGGKMVIPVASNILEITRASEQDYETQVHLGFVFVPLV
jgi:protein-L-isoaspartate(D-aspartate) O-methyltransferase